MAKNEVDYYVNNILKKQLQKLKVSNYGLYAILDNVKNQLNSIIKNWNNHDLINIFFLTVIEEASFYNPIADDKIKGLVVLGIRNSLLETIASVDYKLFGLKQCMSDQDIKEITTNAITYFKNVDLNKLSSNIVSEKNYYLDVIQKYPNAYKVLFELSKCTCVESEKSFEIIKNKPYIIEEVKLYKEPDQNVVKTIMSGISEKFDAGLIGLLKGILDGTTSFFYIDSFKYLSRNFEKNLKVIEFILTHNGIFLTNNFFISNGYVSRRKILIRANHGSGFNLEAIKSIGAISKKYKKKLEKMFQLDDSIV
ncbi:MAG: hypothetical protein PHN72_02215 [Bacilli bacterium]|nr:hypothetical protein [Bacilli bacterium]